MSKTHTHDIVSAAKRVKNWLVDKAKGAGRPTTQAELTARVAAICPKTFTENDRDAVESASLVFFKRADPDGHARMAEQYVGNGK